MRSARGLRTAFSWRLLATWRVWRPGGDHMALLADVEERRRARARRLPSPPAASIDVPAPGSTVSRSVVEIHGWALATTGTCSRVELTVNGHPVGRARLGTMRRDVEAHMGVRAAATSGFHHSVDLSEVPRLGGRAEIGGFAVAIDGTRFNLPSVHVTVDAPEPEPELPRPPRAALPPVARKRLCAAAPSDELRVLVCTHELGYGGAQLFLAELLRRIAVLGPVRGLVLSPSEGPTRGPLEHSGFDVHVTSPFPVGSLDEYDGRLEELAGWAARGDFDVALVNTMVAFPGADLALRLGLPTLWAIHESWRLPEYWAMFEGVVHRDVQRRAEAALRRATVAFTCDATRSLYPAALETLTLPYGIDVEALDAWRDTFDRAAARRVEGIGDEDTVLLCVGTIEPRKAQTQLIQAFAHVADRHPRAVLELVGSRDDHHSAVAAEAVSVCGLGDRVRIRPVLADVRPRYAMADVLVSASDVESTPRSMLEAMALGLPVLSTDVFGVPELIADGESGWLSEPRDVAALAAALDRVLSLGSGERAKVAARARATVEQRYRSEACAPAWAEALRELASSPAVSIPRVADQPLRTRLGRVESNGS